MSARTGYAPREGDIVIDVGAGIGEFTLWCADAGARVIAFEPDPLAFACLEKNTASLPSVRDLSPMRCGRSAPISACTARSTRAKAR